MLHTTIAMISSTDLAHMNWGSMLVGLQRFAMHVMDAHGGIWP